MLEDYTAWAEAIPGVVSCQDLIQHLSSPDAIVRELLDKVSNEAATFENSLNKDMYFVSSLGYKVNGDRRTKDNLNDLYTYFDMQASPAGQAEYRDFDNNIQAVNKEHVKLLLLEHVTNGQMLYQQKWAMQQALTDIDSFDKLKQLFEAKAFDFVMQDFSKQSAALCAQNFPTQFAKALAL